jgi:hypothetical protein
MIPSFDAAGNLPAGIHLPTWGEFLARFGCSPYRQRLAGGLLAAITVLHDVGCRRLYVDGSFVTGEVFPNDYDAAWDPSGVDLPLLLAREPVFFDFSNFRAAQKAKFFGEFFPASSPANRAGSTFLEFFQIDKNTGNPKGIIALNL